MKVGIKILIAFATTVLAMLLLPLVVIKCFPDWLGIGFLFVTFFTVNPIVITALSIMAGTDIRRLWWIPLAISALFPLLFGIAISYFVWDLYFYSAIYLPIGILGMLVTHFGVKHSSKGKGGQ